MLDINRSASTSGGGAVCRPTTDRRSSPWILAPIADRRRAQRPRCSTLAYASSAEGGMRTRSRVSLVVPPPRRAGVALWREVERGACGGCGRRRAGRSDRRALLRARDRPARKPNGNAMSATATATSRGAYACRRSNGSFLSSSAVRGWSTENVAFGAAAYPTPVMSDRIMEMALGEGLRGSRPGSHARGCSVAGRSL